MDKNPFNLLKGQVYLVPISAILPNPHQVRLVLDKTYIASLAKSIKERGLEQTPRGRLANNKVELIFGHNRLAAYKLLAKKDQKYKFIPVEIVNISKEEMFLQALAENVDRDNLKVTDVLNVIEISKKFGYTSEKIGEKMNMSGAAIRSLWRLKKLPPEILNLVDNGRISQVTARRILSAIQFLADPKIIVQKVLALADISEASVQEAIFASFKENGGVQVLNLSDGSTDKMRPDWDPGEFEPRQWRQLSSAYPFRDLSKEIVTRLLSDDPNPQGRLEDISLDMLTHMRRPGPCKSCDYSISMNKTTFCAISACYRMKQERLINETMARLTAETGIQPYRDGDGSFRDTEAPFYEESKSVIKALKQKSQSLRLLRDPSLTHTHYYSNSHWVKVIWVGKKSTHKADAPQLSINKDAEHKELIGADMIGLADYATPLLAVWLRDNDDFMVIAPALLKIRDTNDRTNYFYLMVARKIITSIINQLQGQGVQNDIPAHLASMSGKFGIPLPEDWKKKITSLGFSKGR